MATGSKTTTTNGKHDRYALVYRLQRAGVLWESRTEHATRTGASTTIPIVEDNNTEEVVHAETENDIACRRFDTTAVLRC